MRLLDLFCGAGGAAMGYSRAGFDEIIGVDIAPQPRYPFTFVQADALEYVAEYGHEFDAIHASPPCQYYSRLRFLPWLKDKVYWRSIPPTRDGLDSTGKPWVIENVEDAGWDMLDSFTLCGRAFGLPIFRHRRFETSNLPMWSVPHMKHTSVIVPGRASLAKRRHGMVGINAWGGPAGHQGGTERHKAAMGIDWMTGDELTQAVPPAFTEFIGTQLLEVIEGQ